MNDFSPARLVAARAAAFADTAIIRMSQKAHDLMSKGHDVISLAVGEPDFATPDRICAAATQAMADGYTHYTPVAGYADLRAAIARKLERENELIYDASEIVVANGAKQAIANALFALLDPGDEVVLLAPFWSAYLTSVEMVGGRPVVLSAGADAGFKVNAERIAAALTPRTKLLILNSPGNPTGAMYDQGELQAIARIVQDHGRAMVLSDEIYEYIRFDAEHVSIGSLSGMRERTITVNGFSKGFAMTGWRLGYAAAPEPVARAMARVQGAITAGANAFGQRAAIAALEGGRDEVEQMRTIYGRRRALVVDMLSRIDGLTVAPPAGSFYIFPDVAARLGATVGNHRLDTVDEFAEWLLDEHHVATVPGTGFGDDRCLRLSFAASEDHLERALQRLQAAFAQSG